MATLGWSNSTARREANSAWSSSCRPLPAADARELQIREVRLDERRHWWVRFDDGLTLVARSRERRLSAGSVLPGLSQSGRATGTTPGAICGMRMASPCAGANLPRRNRGA